MRRGWALFALAMLAATGGCTRHSHVIRITLWEGQPDCSACQAQAVTLWPNGSPRVSLRPNSVYTAELELDTSGDPDRCIFRFVSGSWELPSHTFDCDPEQDVMRRVISTRRFSPSSGPDRLSVRVDVLSLTDRRGIELLLDSQRYEVDWVR